MSIRKLSGFIIAMTMSGILGATSAQATTFTQTDLDNAQAAVSGHQSEINSIYESIQALDVKLGAGYLYNPNGTLWYNLDSMRGYCNRTFVSASLETCHRDVAEAYETEFNSTLSEKSYLESNLSVEYASLDAAQIYLAYVTVNCCAP